MLPSMMPQLPARIQTLGPTLRSIRLFLFARVSRLKAMLGGHHVFWGAVVFVVLFSFAHTLALPLAISYDGYIYIDLGDMLGSPDLPERWHVFRGPLFPLALKVGTAVLGRQANAATAVVTSFGLATALIVGATTRLLVGPLAGAVAMVLIALYPSFVA